MKIQILACKGLCITRRHNDDLNIPRSNWHIPCQEGGEDLTLVGNDRFPTRGTAIQAEFRGRLYDMQHVRTGLWGRSVVFALVEDHATIIEVYTDMVAEGHTREQLEVAFRREIAKHAPSADDGS